MSVHVQLTWKAEKLQKNNGKANTTVVDPNRRIRGTYKTEKKKLRLILTVNQNVS